MKVGVAFIFHHLVDVTALWHTSKVFESSLNNVKLFLVCLPTLIRLFDLFLFIFYLIIFILKENKFWCEQTVFCPPPPPPPAEPVENLR